MANIITELHLEMSDNWYVSKKLNSIGRVGENTVTKLIIEPTEIINNVTYEIEIMSADGSKNVAELTIDGTELYLILTANMLTTSGIMKMQVRGLFTDGSVKKSNIFELKVNRSISATEHYEEYAVTIFDQLVNECRDIIEGAESYAVRAETAAVNAEAYSESASASAESASASAITATTASEAAVNAKTSAESASTSAHTSAETATTAANSASASASNASTSATNAANSAVAAATSATNAHNSEVNASTSETNASTSATEAAASAESIAASVAQINENTYRINDLEAIIAGYQQADLPTGAVASVTDGTALLMPSLKVEIEPAQEGSGDPSPENIRPISGWDECNVTRTGKNILKLSEWELASDSGMIIDTNNIIITSTPYQETLNKYNVQTQSTCMFSFHVKVVEIRGDAALFRVYANSTLLNEIRLDSVGTEKNITVVIPNGTKYISFGGWQYNGKVEISNIQLELGSTATTYEPYNGQTYTIEFRDGDNPLTVYGGTLDVTSGELVVDRAYKEFDGTENWSRYPETTNIPVFFAGISGILPNSWIKNKSSIYKCLRWEPLNNRTDFSLCVHPALNIIYIADSRYTTVNEFATAMNGVQLCYELAEPTTYHLTPTQVRTLVGNNNIWADTGDIISGKYFKSLS